MKQKNLSKKNISKKLNYLKEKLPKPPVPIKDYYQLPIQYGKEFDKTGYSQELFQEIADNIGAYLGLLNSVKVTIGLESYEHQLADAESLKNADRVGLYKVKAFGGTREIFLLKKYNFAFRNVLAILCHESVHNYLFQHQIMVEDEYENELLTEIATAYLGFGHYVYKGYRPVTWTTDYKEDIFEGTSYTSHSYSIGYVTSKTIIRAMIMSVEIRGWDPYKISDLLDDGGDIIWAYFKLWGYRKRYKILEKERLQKEKELFKVITCSECNQKMRVPKDKGTITVICPKCKNKFSYDPVIILSK